MTAKGIIQGSFTGIWNVEKFSRHISQHVAFVDTEYIVGRFLGLKSFVFNILLTYIMV